MPRRGVAGRNDRGRVVQQVRLDVVEQPACCRFRAPPMQPLQIGSRPRSSSVRRKMYPNRRTTSGVATFGRRNGTNSTSRTRGLRNTTRKRSSGSKKWNVTTRSRAVLRTVRIAAWSDGRRVPSTTPSGRRRRAWLIRSVRSRITAPSPRRRGEIGLGEHARSTCSSGRSAVTRSPSIDVPTMRARICSGRSRPSTSRRQRPSSTVSRASSPGVSDTLYSSSPHCTPVDCHSCSTSISTPYRIPAGWIGRRRSSPRRCRRDPPGGGRRLPEHRETLEVEDVPGHFLRLGGHAASGRAICSRSPRRADVTGTQLGAARSVGPRAASRCSSSIGSSFRSPTRSRSRAPSRRGIHTVPSAR